MSTDTATELQDDATVVHDEDVEEKGREELVGKVTKLLSDTPGDEPETPGKPEDTAAAGEETAEELSEEFQARVKDAGLTDDLARKLHESGQLEETLAAFDRRMIDYIQSRQEKSAKDEKGRDKEPSQDDVPALDPEIYDEALVARDAAQTKRIEALEALVEQLVSKQDDGFDQWFDGVLADLGCSTSDSDKCQSVFKAYGAMCDAFGVEVDARNSDMVRRAYAAMYPQDVFKKQVERLRDTKGKFVSSPASRGGPPPKDATDDEVQAHLLSRVTSYLKEQGVQMSGY